MYCEKCGKELLDQSVFCPYCGSRNTPPATAQVYGKPQKSKIAAGILGILVGAFGVHNFYLGYTGKAVAQLLITLLTCGVGGAVSSVWGLVEGILILTDRNAVDADGIPLRD